MCTEINIERRFRECVCVGGHLIVIIFYYLSTMISIKIPPEEESEESCLTIVQRKTGCFKEFALFGEKGRGDHYTQTSGGGL